MNVLIRWRLDEIMMVWHVWYGMVWYGMAWCGVVWHVWYGMVRCGGGHLQRQHGGGPGGVGVDAEVVVTVAGTAHGPGLGLTCYHSEQDVLI